MSPVWPFADPADTEVSADPAVLAGAPVRVVHRDDQGAWSFDATRHRETHDERLMTLGEIVALDPALREVADLPPRWLAWRLVWGSKWARVTGEEADRPISQWADHPRSPAPTAAVPACIGIATTAGDGQPQRF